MQVLPAPCWATQLPALQKSPLAQSVSRAQVVGQPLAVQTYAPQLFAAGVTQLPLPLQVEAG